MFATVAAMASPDLAPPAGRSPLSASERIDALDVLRGVALLGIFVVNMATFGHSIFAPPATEEWHTADGIVASLRELLFAGKFNLMFGLVFGIGFTLQLRRLEVADAGGAAFVYVRRLTALLGIGLVHAAFLWMGDVLVAYSVLGFGLLALRRAPTALVVLLLAACLLYPAASDVLSAQFFSTRTAVIGQFRMGELAASNDQAFGHGGFIDAVRETMQTFAWAYTTPLGVYTVFSFFVQMGTGILLGFLVGRRGWISKLDALRVPMRRAQLGALALALAAGSAWYVMGGNGGPDGSASFGSALARTSGRASLMAFYALTVLRLAVAPGTARAMRIFAWPGRMPLTNYLLQTIMGLAIFYGWGLGWWDQTGAMTETALAFALYIAVQIPLSAWWLSRFRYGPVEFVWRRVTYGTLKRSPSSSPTS
ncbi:MAG: DUF418 domain-containing protein [Caldimonas sp.]